MRSSQRKCYCRPIVCVVVLLLPLAGYSQEETLTFRGWTNAQGREADLAFVKIADGKLQMQNREGKSYTLALDTFSAEDQKRFLDEQVERALTLKSSNQNTSARELLRSLTRLDPQYAPAFFWQAKQRAESDDIEGAIESYRTYWQLDPKDVKGPLSIARLYRQQEQQELATLWYERAALLDPESDTLRAEMNEDTSAPSDTAGTVDSTDSSTPDSPPPIEVEPTQQPTSTLAPTPTETNPAPNDEDRRGFWSQGVVGLLGGRTVWWGRLIGIVL